MSIHSMSTITCPNCGNKQDFMIWESLNGDLDPDAKKMLLDGTLFNFKCKECGFEAEIDYDILYHDMSQNTMVFLVGEDQVETAKAQIDFAQQATMKAHGPLIANLNIPKTRNRIVTSQNRLREKALIFNSELDDRIVEIVKLLCWLEIHKQFNEIEDGELYFFVKDDKYSVVVPGRGISCNVPNAMYQQISQRFGSFLDLIGDNQYIVDNNFAGDVLIAFDMANSDGGSGV